MLPRSPLSTQARQAVGSVEIIDLHPVRRPHRQRLERVQAELRATTVLFALLAACWLLRAFGFSG